MHTHTHTHVHTAQVMQAVPHEPGPALLSPQPCQVRPLQMLSGVGGTDGQRDSLVFPRPGYRTITVRKFMQVGRS